MTNNTPATGVTTIVTGIIQSVDHKSNRTITKALGDVERCVNGYSKRTGFFGKLGGLIYRLWNAVKAIFSQSDWQKGRRALSTLNATLPNHPIITTLKKKEAKIRTSYGLLQTTAGDLLQMIIFKNNNHNPSKTLKALISLNNDQQLRLFFTQAALSNPYLRNPERCYKIISTIFKDESLLTQVFKKHKETPHSEASAALPVLGKSLDAFKTDTLFAYRVMRAIQVLPESSISKERLDRIFNRVCQAVENETKELRLLDDDLKELISKGLLATPKFKKEYDNFLDEYGLFTIIRRVVYRGLVPR